MYKVKIFLMTVAVLFIMFGCLSEKTRLSEEIKNMNPYQVDQKLTFISSLDVVNTLEIKNIKDGQFPDGMGAFLNERLFVSAFRESKTISGGTEERILTVLASTDKYEEKIDFSLSLRDTYLQMDFVMFSDYQNRPMINLITDFYEYDDIVLFKNYPDRKKTNDEIVEFYWSKSFGYVRLIQNNGVVWDLKSVE
jgi:hypothetical protein